MLSRAYVGLGANLGAGPGGAPAQVQLALDWMAADAEFGLVAVSSLYRTAPVEAQGPDFYNAVAALDTSLAPLALLRRLQALEARAGRERPYRNAPRTLDLDLLLYGQVCLDDEVLTLPHPRLHLRAFVLWPLRELAPNLEIPGRGNVQFLAEAVSDQAIERVAFSGS